MQIATHLTEIFTTNAGTVSQCDRRNRLEISFSGMVSVVNIETFLRLKRVVDSIDLEEMALNTKRSSDLEIIAVCGCDPVFILSLIELHAFKELLAGAKFILELNSVLHECLSSQFTY
jgi:uncharacterized Fe-S cluster-containing radical SAM superfamily protein